MKTDIEVIQSTVFQKISNRTLEELEELKIMERYIQRKRLASKGNDIDILLATTQKQIKAKQDYLDFLEDIKNEYK